MTPLVFKKIYAGVPTPTPIPLSTQIIYNLIMFYVYILKSLKDNNIYFGSTKARRPFELRYYEAYFEESEARHREASLKKDGRALAQLKRRITDSLQ
jgi:predicted GIY-YIG superfamily endonuclease